MGIIFDQGNLNVAALTTPNDYIEIIPPPSFVLPQPTNAIGIVGTASWGPLNTATPLGSSTDDSANYGGIQAGVSNLDPFDLCTDVEIALGQAQTSASLFIWGVRIDDGTSVAAFYALKDTTSGSALTGITLTALYTGICGNLIKIIISAGSKTNTYNVQIVPSFPGAQAELYQNIAGAGSTFWANLATAINNGQFGLNTKSKLVTAGTPNGSAITPALGSFTLTGGTDGRSGVTAASFIGSDVIGNRTGIYALRKLNPIPGLFWCAGLTDSTKFTNLLGFANQESTIAVGAFPSGTSTTAAITAKQGVAIDSYRFIFCKDFLFWNDPVNGYARLVPPYAFAIGRIASMSPEQSPLNKAVYNVVGSERTTVYPDDEIGLLETNGILVITPNVPGGNYWGFPVGNNSSSNPATAPIEYSRMILYTAISCDKFVGKFVGQLQGTTDPDPVGTRPKIKSALDNFLQQLQDNLQIDSYLPTVCDMSNNSNDSIAQGYNYADIQVKFLSSIKYEVIRLTGGTTVNTSTAAASGTNVNG